MTQRKEQKDKRADLKKLLLEPEVESWRELMLTKKAVFNKLESCFQKEGYTVPRFEIMFNLYFEGPMSPTQLTSISMFSKGNTSMFLKRMISDGLIEAVEGKSKKRPYFDLTDRGKKEFEQLFPRHIGRVKKLMLPLSKELLNKLNEIKENVAKVNL